MPSVAASRTAQIDAAVKAASAPRRVSYASLAADAFDSYFCSADERTALAARCQPAEVGQHFQQNEDEDRQCSGVMDCRRGHCTLDTGVGGDGPSAGLCEACAIACTTACARLFKALG